MIDSVLKIMMMQSQEKADKIIDEIRYVLNNNYNKEISIEYDDSDLLEQDRERIKKEIEKFSKSQS